MTDSLAPAEPLPSTRSCPFDPEDGFARLRAEEPVSLLAMPGDHVGVLLTKYDDVRALLTDPRFSSKWDKMHSPVAYLPPEAKELFFGAPGMFIALDPPEHTRYRRMVTRQFTLRRVKAMEPRIRKIVTDQLDEMEKAGPSADLVEMFALPVPSLVIAELLGVPEGDRRDFSQLLGTMTNSDLPIEEILGARFRLLELIGALVTTKREDPSEDIFSWLINDQTDQLTQEELVTIGLMLITAGNETTSGAIALGSFVLMEQPDQLALLKERPELMDGAMDELLRYLPVVKFGVTRVATEDVDFGGHLIKKDQTVVASLASANRDADQFENPDVLDVTRRSTGQLSFGHGLHQCSGQHLTRLEMKIAFTELFNRFPDLRSTVPVNEVPRREATAAYGLTHLPVTWG